MTNLCEMCEDFRDGLSARPDDATYEETRRLFHQEDADDGTKDFALFYAVSLHHFPCVVELLSSGENCNQTSKVSKRTPLILASQKGHSDIVKLLLDSGADCNIKDTMVKSALWYASSDGYASCVSLLLEAGAQVDYVDKYTSLTPLQAAVWNGHVACMEALLKQGAKIKLFEAKNNNWFLFGMTMHQLETPVLKKILSLIAEREGALTLDFFIGVVNKNVKSLLQWILDEAILIKVSASNTKPNYNENLHLAAENGNDETIEVLLQNKTRLGIEINGCFGLDKRTALQKSCDQDVDNVVEVLLKYGADPDKIGNINTEGARPPVFVTLRTLSYSPCGLKILRALIQHGCNLEIKYPMTLKGMNEKVSVTPLEYALHGHNLFAAKMLIMGGALRYNPTFNMMKSHKKLIPRDLECTKKDKEEFISKELEAPRPLYQLGRISVRNALGRNPEDKIYQLPLPRHVQEFLLLHDLNEIAENFEIKMEQCHVSSLDDQEESDASSDEDSYQESDSEEHYDYESEEHLDYDHDPEAHFDYDFSNSDNSSNDFSWEGPVFF